jgi:hypothetical protein
MPQNILLFFLFLKKISGPRNPILIEHQVPEYFLPSILFLLEMFFNISSFLDSYRRIQDMIKTPSDIHVYCKVDFANQWHSNICFLLVLSLTYCFSNAFSH